MATDREWLRRFEGRIVGRREHVRTMQSLTFSHIEAATLMGRADALDEVLQEIHDELRASTEDREGGEG